MAEGCLKFLVFRLVVDTGWGGTDHSGCVGSHEFNFKTFFEGRGYEYDGC